MRRALLVAVPSVLTAAGCGSDDAPRPLPAYVASDTCAACHPAEAEAWHKPRPLSGADVIRVKVVDFDKDDGKREDNNAGIKISYFD